MENSTVFTSQFSGKEHFLLDHVLNDDRILPAVAYLEMVSTAFQLEFKLKITSFVDVTWFKPFVFEKGKSIEVAINVHESNFEVFSIVNGSNIIHCSGKLRFDEVNLIQLNLKKLKEQFEQKVDKIDFYNKLSELGLQLGHSFQGIESVYFNEGKVLTRANLPLMDEYTLNLGSLDVCFQSCFGFVMNQENQSLYVPFSVKEIQILKPLTTTMWAYVCENDTLSKDESIRSYDVNLMDDNGNVLLKFSDFVALTFNKNHQSIKKIEKLPVLSFYEQYWIEKKQKEEKLNLSTEVILLGGSAQLGDAIKERTELETWSIQPENESHCFEEVFEIVRSKILEKNEAQLLLLYRNSEVTEYGFLSGLLKTAQQENPNFHTKLIGVDNLSIQKVEEMVSIIENESCSIGSIDIRYENNVREEKQLEEVIFAKELFNKKVLKEGGVYLVTGGFGGLGQIFSDYILRTKDTRVILTGRSALSVEKQEQLSLNPRLEYRQSDVTDRNSLSDLLESIRKEYGSINGVLHSAGTTKDSFIQNKELEDIRSVLSPKIVGTRNLDELTKEDELDFMIYFSSIAGVIGNVGQSDYASANSYMDHYAVYRQQLVGKGLRSGKSKSINWPYWASGGIQLGTEMLRMLEDRWGMTAMPTEEGIKAFENLFISELVAGTVSYGKEPLIEKILKKSSTNVSPGVNKKIPNDQLLDLMETFLIEIASSILKLDKNKLKKNKELGIYGMDSVMITQFIEQVNKRFNLTLSPITFFNNPTIEQFASYLVVEQSILIIDGENENAGELPKETIETTSKNRVEISDENAVSADAIAIIGMSGRFPGSENVEEFWRNLKENKDLIQEVPKNRWDWENYFGDPLKSPNKTHAKWGGFMDNVDEFDSLFFNISPAEAELMDPQHRIAVESVYHAFEDAAIDISALSGSNTGVFIGVFSSDYSTLTRKGNSLYEAQRITGISQALLTNRISYLFNFHGPSEPIDTACSSSLVAIHRAVENIRSGHCKLAVAGGVSLDLIPENLLSMSQAGMLSKDGRCKTFDRKADGYVRGEGVGMVVLKSLSDAEKDGDPIYAVIRSSNVNHGGRTNTLTTPNPSAQRELIRQAIQKAGILPSDISLIEAHGTGTPLGDPIEIESLKQAFNDLKGDIDLPVAYCGIGSVKANIGHLESAAGIASVVKVLLSMKYGYIPGNPHLENVNPYIQLDKSPFYLCRETRKWETGNKSKIAGISSFGFGGSNAHIILESYDRNQSKVVSSNSKSLVLFSAKSQKSLIELISRNLAFLKENRNLDLEDYAYTLQVGRETKNVKVAFIATTIEDLINKLEEFNLCPENFILNQQSLMLSTPLTAKEIESSLIRALEERNLDDLIPLWAAGGIIRWEKLFDRRPTKLHLPVYSFEKERHWVNEENISDIAQKEMHPLIHQNCSNLKSYNFRSFFKENSIFFRDHVIDQIAMMPGAAMVEMFAYTFNQVVGESTFVINDIQWENLLTTERKEIDLQTSIKESNGQFELLLTGSDTTFCSAFIESIESVQLHINIEDVLEFPVGVYSGEECYQIFESLGMKYGPAFRRIKNIYKKEESIIAHIESIKETDYILNPFVIDAVFQSCIGFSMEDETRVQKIPVSVDKMVFFKKMSEVTYAIAKRGKYNNDDFESFSITVVDQDGNICLEIEEFTVKKLNNTVKIVPKSFLYDVKWKESIAIPKQKELYKEETNSKLIFVNLLNSETDKITVNDSIRSLNIQTIDETDCFNQLVKIIQKDIEDNCSFYYMVIYENNNNQLFGCLTGLFKSLTKERIDIRGKILEIDNEISQDISFFQKCIYTEMASKGDYVRYKNSKRFEKQIEPLEIKSNQRSGITLTKGGVYLITGGASGLGAIFANYISRIQDIQLVVVGRSIKTEEIEHTLQELSKSIQYYSCDVSDAIQVKNLFVQIEKNHGIINGIIHSAGYSNDLNIMDKTTENIQQVLAPKISGIKNLDEYSAGYPLDFFISFSSISSIIGNEGQVDYATANAFLDDFSFYRNQLASMGLRSGKSISINWPLWEDGGMKMSSEIVEYLSKSIGFALLPTKEGLKDFEFLINHCENQGVVYFGSRDIFQKNQKKDDQFETNFDFKFDNEVVVDFIKNILAIGLKIDKKRIENDTSFDQFGINSLMISRLLNEFSTYFQNIPRTLFFECQSLDELVEYFKNEHKSELYDHLNDGNLESKNGRLLYSSLLESNSIINKIEQIKDDSQTSNVYRREIAIIGLSGRYPGANSIPEFWEILKNGLDCITEIPDDRWSLDQFYDAEKRIPGKSFSKWGGFLSDVDKFDPLFFNISPRDAELMDPQERLFLQTVWSTMEDAGYTRRTLRSNAENGVGVFVGVMNEDYPLLGLEEFQKGNYINVGGSPSSIANRVSYVLNLEGPSLAIDTMCSSSLTSIHYACSSIFNGDCDMAFAGGVNVSIHPNKYRLLSQNNFVSSQGKCMSFGEGGEGYVPAEGVGAVLLKSLDQAILDGDHIYGVIKSTAINHGGKTNGYTVPNPKAQSSVIKKAMARANIKAEDISYIEAHGTGTSLGDPIEVRGLISAFESQKKQFCRLGSVKSNIGHAESAAGISGLTKILLQMKNKMFVPSLHSEKLNSTINFENSPFTVQQNLEPWISDKERISGISSFGAGGSNAHILIGEYETKVKENRNLENETMVFVLSAKTVERLNVYIGKIVDFISSEDELNWQSFVYTFQIGREEMDVRLALIANGFEELVELLQLFLIGKEDKRINFNNCKLNQIDALADQYLNEIHAQINIPKIAQYWVSGAPISWNKLYAKRQISKISTPTYPFQEDRYWIPNLKKIIEKSPNVHPLLHSHETREEAVLFTSIYSGNEFFFEDHIVNDRKILPGVAYLEMALSGSRNVLHQNAKKVKNLTWLTPFSIENDPKKVQIVFEPNGKDVDYSVFSTENENKKMHGTGVISYLENEKPTCYDLSKIRNKMSNSLAKNECYQLFEQLGIKYGKSFQGIETLFYSDIEALSRIQLPIDRDFILNPGILDSALQTCLGMGMNNLKSGVSLPYNVDEVTIHRALDEHVWCYVRNSSPTSIEGKLKQYDIDLLDDKGESIVSFKKLGLIQIENKVVSPNEVIEENEVDISNLLYVKSWNRIKQVDYVPNSISGKLFLLISADLQNESVVAFRKTIEKLGGIVTCDTAIHSIEKQDHIVFLDGLIDEKNKDFVELKIFKDLQKIYQNEGENVNLSISVFTKNVQKIFGKEQQSLKGGGLIGLIGSLAKEQKNWNCNVIDISQIHEDQDTIEKLLCFRSTESGSPLAFRKGFWYSMSMSKIHLNKKENTIIKNNGVYVLLGGAGGLGKVTSEYLIKKYQAQVVWLGRREMSEDIGQALDEMSKLGKRPVYISCNANDRNSLENARKKIKDEFGEVNGLFHSAIVLNDMLVKNMSEEDFSKSFDPKSTASQNFIEVFNSDKMDFVCFYSSLQALTHSAGQANYAAGCAYKDAYSRWLNDQIKAKVVTINWGYWGEVGIVATEEYRKRMSSIGVGSINKTEGMQILETLLNSENHQLIALKTL